MSVLAQRTTALSIPAGSWPSLLVLTIVLTLLGSVYLVGLLGSTIFSGDSAFLPGHRVPWFTESVIEYHMDYAMNSNEYNDVVFLGASATLAGIIPQSLEDSTGLRGYNLGTGIDIGPDGHLEIFRAYLQSHPKPQMLVYTAFPRDVGDTRGIDQELRGRFTRAYGRDLRVKEVAPPRGPRHYFQEGFWSLYGYARSALRHPYDAPRGNRPSHRELGPMLATQRGFQEYPQALLLNLDYLKEIEAFTVSDWYDESLIDMAQLAQENDIDFMVWFMPIPRSDAVIDDGPLLTWAEQFTSKFPEVAIEGLPIQTYELDLWGNPFHLNRTGAEIFTQQVAQRVVALLGHQVRGQP